MDYTALGFSYNAFIKITNLLVQYSGYFVVTKILIRKKQLQA